MKGINISANFRVHDTSLDNDLMDIYARLYGEEQLLIAQNESFYPKRYQQGWDWYLKREITEINLASRQVKKLIDEVVGKYTKMWLLIFLIERTLKIENDIDFAISLIDELPSSDLEKDGSTKYKGYRLVLDYYAGIGDLEKFNDMLELSSPSKPLLQDVQNAKRNLICQLTEKFGWEYSYKIAKKKDFGKKYFICVLKPLVKKMSLRDIEEILINNNTFIESDPYLKEKVWTEYFQHELNSNHNTFTEVFELVIKIDRDVKFGDYRLRDSLLFDISSKLYDIQLVELCKKFCISPVIKKELNYRIKNLSK